MKTKIVFASATALGLLMATGAFADSNTAVVDQGKIGSPVTGNTASINQSGGSLNTSKIMQNGTGNSADVTQAGGLRNDVGTFVFPGWDDPTTTARRTAYGFIYQNGNSNEFTVLQTQNGSSVGGAGGVTQTGNENVVSITQKGGVNNLYAGVGGSVGAVNQTASGSATHLTNKLTVSQGGASLNAYADLPANSSDYNYAIETIGTVNQTNTGGAANKLTLTQKGGTYNAGNNIVSVTQSGVDNTGSVTQQGGRRNYLALLSQTGSGNDATLTFTGERNGSGGASFTSAAALASGVTQARAIQDGANDQLTYTATGNDNLYGFSQTIGSNNEIFGTTTGNTSEVGVNQAGGGNFTGFTQNGITNLLGVNITGDDNGVGAFRAGAAADVAIPNGQVTQIGGTNTATITITGSDANYSASQTGGNNTLTLSLTGGDNNNFAVSQAGQDTATINVTGGQNVLGAIQKGSAGPNSLEVTIVGSLNNWSSTMSGDAGLLGLKAGSIYQENNGAGLNNDVNLMVTTSSNLFAVKQIGSNNKVTGTVSTGDSNQAAVSQIGSTNTASFVQNGGGNNVGITQ